ncbi:hypothetical protein LguiA_029350 [Lonicera macranthoides]
MFVWPTDASGVVSGVRVGPRVQKQQFSKVVRVFAEVTDRESKPEWIEEVKSEGAVPFLDPNNCPNGWASPPGDNFKVRGPEYFSTKVKIPDGQYLLKPLGFDWLKGDDRFKNLRLKLITNIVKGHWIVKKIVGEQAICIIGRALTCKYTICESFMEVDIDIGSSVVVSAVVHLALGYTVTLTVDITFLIESQTESELPERILGAIKFSELKITSAMTVEPPYDAVPREL